MKTTRFLLAASVSLAMVISCSSSSNGDDDPGSSSSGLTPSSSSSGGTLGGLLIDARDNQTYRIVVMPDGKTWMSENLNYVDNSWPQNNSSANFISYSALGSWCYGNTPSNCDEYGRLYTWNAAMVACPEGWHLPSNNEWKALVDAIGDDPIRKLKATSGWTPIGDSSNGTDDYEFSALPGGYRDRNSTVIFKDIGIYGNWWTSTQYATEEAQMRYIIANGNNVYAQQEVKGYGYSVRCVKD